MNVSSEMSQIATPSPETTPSLPDDYHSISLAPPNSRALGMVSIFGDTPEKRNGIRVSLAGLDIVGTPSHLVFDSPRITEKELLPPPMPWSKILAICSAVFCVSLSMLICLPIYPFMVMDFYPNLSKEEVGYYSGMLIGMMFFGTICFAPAWQIAIDKFGYRYSLLIGTFLQAVLVTVFGFSSSYRMAVIIRFFWGACNGNIFIARSLIFDTVPKEYQALALPMIEVSFGIGALFGPALGGLLANHCEKYNLNMFCDFPFALPTTVAGLICTISCIVIYFFVVLDLSEPVIDAIKPGEGGAQRTNETVEESTSIPALKLMEDPQVWKSIFIYTFCNMGAFGIDSIIPLWLLNNKEDYGFNFGTSEIGILFTITAVAQIQFLLFCFPTLCENYSMILVFKCLLSGNCAFCVFTKLDS